MMKNMEDKPAAFILKLFTILRVFFFTYSRPNNMLRPSLGTPK